MSELAEISISELAKGIRGVTYKPHQLKEDVGLNDYYLLRSNNIQNGTVDFDDMQIVDQSCVSEKQKLIDGDIIVCMSNGSRQLVGKSALVKLLNGNFCVGSFCSSFRVNPGINPNFVFQIFRSGIFKFGIDVILSGSAINNLQNKHIEELKFMIPASIEEQNQIAKILSKADAAIAQTEVLIAKYQRIKTGLMQDLLTRGIDEHGDIRSSATHRFVIINGIEVPEEWEVVNLSYFIERLDSGVSVNSEDKPAGAGQLGVLKTSALSGCVFTPIKNKIVDADEISRLKCPVRKGAIIISRMNTPDLVGENALVEAGFDNLFLPDRLWQTVYRNEDELDVYWLSKILSSRKYRTRISFNSSGTSGTMKNITKTDFLSIMIPKPSKTEQEKISLALKAIFKKENHDVIELAKLQSLKTGLMQDLLSGRIRVNVNEKALVNL